jgi:hypothetical protein
MKEREHLREPGLDGRIRRWILKKWDVGEGIWTGSSWLRVGRDGGIL